ncbi:NADH-quinone oxidoreductase subunit NuoF [Carboxydochorda subterranea]|uniref:NADH-quinone oxidoreductase subunit F n=1 Tax=Carboxydichorda subterranea TaxID=3109565 RepID=A0ABZ1BZR8_9FIRM|nr:NADH-quinone oxidoreductase subunit NuoF [Limnochorda sp. L945t]WRP18194.1 NADH-quinone oxidoreductase subunit NuoF [Limnochorda sp. L945t]
MSQTFEPVLTAGIGKVALEAIEGYEAQGGYRALRRAVRELSPEQVHKEVSDSGLRGRGGAGFPTGRKWSFLPKDGRPRYLICNADESEPGTFKDRLLLERNPHLVIEGIMLAGYAIGAAKAFIYLRGEFRQAYEVLSRALAEARQRGYVGSRVLGSDFSLEIVVHRGAGAYICGEETGLLNSLEGRRGEPRLKPPFPAVVGLYGMPTVVNNVETLACIPSIVDRGARWFASIGTPTSPGPKIFSVSGRVRRPGNYELPLGVPLRTLLFDVAGGLEPGRRVKAVQPGGGSSAVLTEAQLDVPLDYESIAKAGSMLGSGAVIVLDDRDCIVQAARILAEFYAHESCGQCTPCREGLHWAARILARIEAGRGRPGDIEVLQSLPGNIAGRTICPLSDAGVGFLQSSLKYFMDEYRAHVTLGRCVREAVVA